MNATLPPDTLAARYQSTNSRIMTLWVTRQNETFITNASQTELCDLHLISASCELVGDPGIGNRGLVSGPLREHNSNSLIANGYGNSINKNAVAFNTSMVLNETVPNKIEMKPNMHHGHLNVFISGLTYSEKFINDTEKKNRLFLTVPTDLGLVYTRNTISYPPNEIVFENVKLASEIQVQSQFFGTIPEPKRRARFVEDFADTDPSTYRNADGTVRYFVDNDESASSTSLCQIPPNCIQCLKLVFVVKPRNTL